MANSSYRKSSKDPKLKVMIPFNMIRRTCIPSLPKEIIYEILLCLPADTLHNIMRLVCREWCNIIKDTTFINAHLQRTSEGILMHTIDHEYYKYAEMGKDGVVITDLNFPQEIARKRRDFGWFRPPNSGWSIPLLNFFIYMLVRVGFPAGVICGSCNGLVVIFDTPFKGIHIANLILKQCISLPHTTMNRGYVGNKIGLAYATKSQKYKVANVYADDDGLGYEFKIFTIGVDKAWRCLGNVEEQSCMPSDVEIGRFFGGMPPLTTAGFIHWVDFPGILSFDVEKERFHFNVVPVGRWENYGSILATETYLSFMHFCKEQKWEQWGLTEVEKGTWMKLRTIDLSAHKHMIQSTLDYHQFYIRPVFLKKNGELVAFICHGLNLCQIMSVKYIFYNVKTRRIQFFSRDGTDGHGIFQQQMLHYLHVKSLISVGDDSRAPTA